MGYRNYGPANGFVVSKDGTGDFTTIAAAITAAGSTALTIFIKQGTYTENLTLQPSVNLAAWDADALTPSVVISGKATFTQAGTVSISGVRLQTNSDFFLAVTGSSASIVNLKNCYLNASNNTGISFSTSSGSAIIYAFNCFGDIGTTGISLFSHSSGGTLELAYSYITTSGSSLTASTVSAGSVKLLSSYINFPITTSSTGAALISYSRIDVNSLNITSATLNGSGSNQMEYSEFMSGTASAISIGGTATIYSAIVNSSNTNAITGSGTVSYGSILFTSTSSLINTSTKTPIALPVLQGGTGLTATTINQVLYSSAANTIAGLATANNAVLATNSSGVPSITATPTVTSISFGGSTLSTYTTGTWTPTLVGQSVAGTTTYAVQTGNYSRIGNIVTVQCDIAISAATGTGNININGLPFAPAQNTASGVYFDGSGWSFPAGRTSLCLFVASGSSTVRIRATGTLVAISDIQMANSALEVIFSFSYLV